ncbi:MAG: YkgJ family cysteine cluster protein [Deltaproteobacteria bacterium]|nr:YkgJ family cysteine cluster protein [Deltaproteobacteria bacterium]
MTDKKFLGKIHGEPWDALAKGPREALAAIWNDYLAEVLQISAKSERYKILRREIEAAAGFKEVYEGWNTLPPESRAIAWRRLMTASRNHLLKRAESCVRCGECCIKGSPILLNRDLGLFHREVLTLNDVYTLRPGEKATTREGEVIALTEERLKVREVPGTRQCWFFLAANQTCRIYEDRPEQCRRQNCWGEPPPPPAPEELLQRRHLFAGAPEMWDLIAAHQARCDCAEVVRRLAEVGDGSEAAGDALFEALHFDHYLRQMLIDDWEMTPGATEFLLGRPLSDFLGTLGLNATLTPEGVFSLSSRREPA